MRPSKSTTVKILSQTSHNGSYAPEETNNKTPDLTTPETITNDTRIGPKITSVKRNANEWGSLVEGLMAFRSPFNQMPVCLTEELSRPVAI
ncbi:hypothetical protein MUBE_13710 [Mycobacterium uberis]|uniref:Uncharacterized protein n=1 Tax=Mycobacterium uberis TaxID=2162698 RepID=A0A3E1HDM7_9MYCO|nr:hypothetical protein MUBE_13710 [Mycobacterium uberis]